MHGLGHCWPAFRPSVCHMSRTGIVGAACAALLTLSACSRDRGTQFGGEVLRGWNPTTLKEVHGVSIATLRTQIQHELAAKHELASPDQWRHVKRLYTAYQNSPLWLDEDGPIKDRADALVDALVNATTDAIQLDPKALYALAQNLDTLRHTKQPSAAQLIRADLLLTIMYVALGEDYLTG